MKNPQSSSKFNLLSILIMFATFNYTQFPIIYVHLNSTIIDDHDFTHFTDEWLKIYKKKQYYFNYCKIHYLMFCEKYIIKILFFFTIFSVYLI